MSNDQSTSEILTTADGTPLEVSLKRALRREKFRAFLLILPLLVFILISFVLPIVNMLTRSANNTIVSDTIPRTVEQLQYWDENSGEAPDEALYAAFAEDMQIAVKERNHTKLGSRLNYDISGIASKFRALGRKVSKWDLEADAPFKEKFIEIDEYWGDPANWAEIKIYSPKVTSGYYASAVDRKLTADG